VRKLAEAAAVYDRDRLGIRTEHGRLDHSERNPHDDHERGGANPDCVASAAR
jgi:hypothetical protein